MWGHMADWGPDRFWFFGGHLMFWVLIVVLVVGLIWWLGRSQPRGLPGQDTALTLLRERYARGEIDQVEFDERRRVLGG